MTFLKSGVQTPKADSARPSELNIKYYASHLPPPHVCGNLVLYKQCPHYMVPVPIAAYHMESAFSFQLLSTKSPPIF